MEIVLRANSLSKGDSGTGPLCLDDFEQKQDENDEEDEADTAAAIVAEAGAHAITSAAN